MNIYLPDDLAQRAREAGLNVSAVAREAIESILEARALNAWLDRVRQLPSLGVTHEEVMESNDAARAEFGDFVDSRIDAEQAKR